MKKEIVISRMFTGKYLNSNLGHEAINLFKADDGCHYIYLNDLGTFGKDHVVDGQLTIDKILLVKPIGDNSVEVLGLACGLSMVYNPTLSANDNDQTFPGRICSTVKYNDVSLNAIYGGSSQQYVCVTFKAEKVLTPTKTICVQYLPKDGQKPSESHNMDYEIVLQMTKTKMGQQLKSYIKEDTEDYKILQTVTDDAKLWADTLQKVDPNAICEGGLPVTYIDICDCSYNENAYSSAIAHFMRKYPELVITWIDKQSKEQPFYPRVWFQKNYPWVEMNVYREWAGNEEHEGGRVDILLEAPVENGKFVCAIENKLHATLEDIVYNKDGEVVSSQLDKYQELLQANYPGYQCVVILLLPDYHPLLHHLDKTPHLRPAIGDYAPEPYNITLSGYPVVTYSQLLAFLEPYIKKTAFKKDTTFIQFVDSLRRHARKTDDGQYLDMMNQFSNKIKG